MIAGDQDTSGHGQSDPPTVSAEDQRNLDHVAEVSKNARTTWFGLIGLLLFCGVTLLGVDDRDFFEYGVSTQLPLIGVSVPTNYFFWAAPMLVTGLYTYLHLYLDKLWKALGRLDDEVGGQPVTEVVYPWLISDTALGMRRESDRGRYWLVTRGVTLLLCWGAGPLVLWQFWTTSWAPHDEFLTLWIGVQLVAVSVLAIVSWLGMRRETTRNEDRWDWLSLPKILFIGILALLSVIAYGWGKTERGKFGELYQAQLYRANFTNPDKDWSGRDRALREYSRRNRDDVIEEFELDASDASAMNITSISETLKAQFDLDRREKRNALKRADKSGIDLRAANLSEAFLVGMDLRGSRFEGSLLRGARLEGANLSGSNLGNSDLSNARLEHANLSETKMPGANLRNARLESADLTGAILEAVDISLARLDGAILSEANLQDATLSHAVLEGADLSLALLQGADLYSAHLGNANLSDARLEGAKIGYADLQGADLSLTRGKDTMLTSSRLDRAKLWRARFPGAELLGSSLINADLTEAIFSGANLYNSKLDHANLLRTDFSGASLSGASLNGAKLNLTDLTDANLEYASAIGASFSKVRGLTQEQLNSMYGDGSSPTRISVQRLEEGRWVDGFLDRPAHWPSVPVPRPEHLACWREWAIGVGAPSSQFSDTIEKCTTHADRP